MKKKHGTNVTQTVIVAPRTPASNGGRAPGLLYAATNPTNCTTMIKGPGVVSARPKPVAMSSVVSQPYRSTACWDT